MSSTVTSLPSLRNACASSLPMGPLPTTISDGTASRRSNTVSLVRYATAFKPGTSGTAGRDPVAMTNVFAVSVRPPASNACGDTNLPSASITSTPRPRNRSGLSLGWICMMTSRTRSITRATCGCGSAGDSAQRDALRIS
jgi:hypothetical protein